MHFYAEHSFYWLIPIVILAFFLSYFLYNKQRWLEELSFKGWKYILISVRFLTLSIVGFLLLDIVVDVVSTRIQKPIIFSIIDDSASMDNYKDSLTVKNEVYKFDSILKNSFKDRYDVKTLLVSDSVRSSSNISFKRDKTNLSSVFDELYNQYYGTNIGACILVSDGNYNEGMSPSYASEKLVNVPVYTIGVGDSTIKRDQSVLEVECNPIAYFQNKFPVKVTLEGVRLEGKKSRVKLYRKGKLLAEELVQFGNNESSVVDVDFLLDADEIGVLQYKVVLERIEGEYSYKNNIRFFHIEVVENRNKVLLISAAPHPDIAAIKSILDADDKNDVKSVLLNEWNKHVGKSSLVIWHDPGLNFDLSLFDYLRKEKIPVLFIAGLNSNQATLNKLQTGVNFSLRYQTEEVQSTLSSDFQLFELSDELKQLLVQFPPLMIHFGQLNLSGKSTPFLNQRIGNINKKDPLIWFYQQDDVKSAMIYGEGIWRWKLTDFSINESNELFSELINKITNYLMIQKNDSPLKIDFPKRILTSVPLKINASFYNASNELINNEPLSFTYRLKKEKNEVQFSKAEKSYSLDLGKLKAGVYEWEAKIKYNGKVYSKSGDFIVEQLMFEDLPTRTNVSVLNEVAVKSNAQFYWLKDADKLINQLKIDESITAVEYQESHFDSLIDEKWLLVFLIFLMTLEWFLRRWLGSY